MSIYVCIECDGCYRRGDEGDRAHLLRSSLRQHGWRQIGRKDYCPECVSSGKHLKKSGEQPQ